MCKKWENDENYIIIDTDRLFSKSNFRNEYEVLIRDRIIELYGDDLENILYNMVDQWYKLILETLKEVDKILVINSAMIKYINNLSIIKGKVIILRTSINKCYERCIQRFKDRNPNAREEEIQVYVQRKKKMYIWYNYLNDFIMKIDKLNK